MTDKIKNLSACYVDGELRLLTPGEEVFIGEGDFLKSKKIYHSERVTNEFEKIRANQWKYVDYEGDGDLDLLVGMAFGTIMDGTMLLTKRENGPMGHCMVIHIS